MHTRYRSWRGDKTFSERSSKVINTLLAIKQGKEHTRYNIQKSSEREMSRINRDTAYKKALSSEREM